MQALAMLLTMFGAPAVTWLVKQITSRVGYTLKPEFLPALSAIFGAIIQALDPAGAASGTPTNTLGPALDAELGAALGLSGSKLRDIVLGKTRAVTSMERATIQ